MAATMALPVLAADDAKPKEITVTGECMCAKCALHAADKCQNVVKVEKDGKTTTYWLAQNDVSKEFHDTVCKENKKVTCTGTVKTEDGKEVMTVSKIEEAK